MKQLTAQELRDWLKEQELELMQPVQLSGHKPTDYILKRQSIIQALLRLVDDVERLKSEATNGLEQHFLSPYPGGIAIVFMEKLRDYTYGGEEKS